MVPGFKWPQRFTAYLRESLGKTETFTECEALETEHANSKRQCSQLVFLGCCVVPISAQGRQPGACHKGNCRLLNLCSDLSLQGHVRWLRNERNGCRRRRTGRSYVTPRGEENPRRPRGGRTLDTNLIKPWLRHLMTATSESPCTSLEPMSVLVKWGRPHVRALF